MLEQQQALSTKKGLRCGCKPHALHGDACMYSPGAARERGSSLQAWAVCKLAPPRAAAAGGAVAMLPEASLQCSHAVLSCRRQHRPGQLQQPDQSRYAHRLQELAATPPVHLFSGRAGARHHLDPVSKFRGSITTQCMAVQSNMITPHLLPMSCLPAGTQPAC